MTDRDALLKAIILHPDDDTPRLVYADWLDENGQPERSEFIRVQCEIARIEVAGTADPKRYADPVSGRYETPPDHSRLMEFRQRELELLESYGTENYMACWRWAPKITTNGVETCLNLSPYNGRAGLLFCRGFVESVTCTAEDWLAHADAIYWHPDQTVECPECDGTTLVYLRAPNGRRFGGGVSTWSGPTRGGWSVEECRRCRDDNGTPTGHVARPFVTTAHPIREVTLTTWPEGSVTIVERQRRWIKPPELGGHILDCWRAEWPSITFHLPG